MSKIPALQVGRYLAPNWLYQRMLRSPISGLGGVGKADAGSQRISELEIIHAQEREP